MPKSSVATLDLRDQAKNYSSRKGTKIDRIVVHHMAGKLTWQQCLAAFKSRNGSATYIIDKDGVCAYVVDEQYRPWTTSTAVIDNRAITIEVANDETGGDWHVSDRNYAILLDLLTDICKRYGLTLTYTGNKATSVLQAHRWWSSTLCPGPYLYGKFPEIATEVQRRLKEDNSKMTIPKGYSKQTINNHAYMIYRQKDGQKIGVLSAGGKNLKAISAHDSPDALIYAKIGGSNFFQMAQGADFGTHYGDEVSPLNGVYQIVPTQNTTIYYNLETGKYGNCTGYYPDKSENVFSPSVVFHDGTYEYAKMVGVNHVNTASIYTALIRLKDGTYIMTLSASTTTPKTMYNDFRSIDGFESMAVLDGGGSAQMQAWHDGKMDSVRVTSRLLPSVVAFYAPKQAENVSDDKTPTEDYKALYEAVNAKYEALQKDYTALEKTADDLRSTITKITEEKQALLGKIKQAADILKAAGE